MIEINKIYENQFYQDCLINIEKKLNLDIKKYNQGLVKNAKEIAKGLNIDSNVIEAAVILSDLGLSIDLDDYIQSSGIIAVKILSDLGYDEENIAKILMAIAGQGNNCNSINILSAVILLGNMTNLEYFLRKNKVDEEIISMIKFKKFIIDYDKNTIDYELDFVKNSETLKLIDYINKIIINSANTLHLSLMN